MVKQVKLKKAKQSKEKRYTKYKVNILAQKIKKALKTRKKQRIRESFLTKSELVHLELKITRHDIMPLPDRVEAIYNIAIPTTKKQLRS